MKRDIDLFLGKVSKIIKGKNFFSQIVKQLNLDVAREPLMLFA